MFYLPMDGKIKIRTLRFPAKESPNMEKALFDWPVVLRYDIKAKYRLISRNFTPERSLNQPKATRVCIRSLTNQIALFPFVSYFCFVRDFHFKVIRKSL